MNVSAQIIGEVVSTPCASPVDAVEQGNTVTVPGPGAPLSEDGLSVVDVTKLETRRRSPWVGTMTSISRLTDGLAIRN